MAVIDWYGYIYIAEETKWDIVAISWDMRVTEIVYSG
jgi:hypothetical protein